MQRQGIAHLGLYIACMVWALGSPAAPARAETPAYQLCIEESPARAGVVKPDAGTHRFCANSVVTVSAEPQAGYQFAFWLGDVSDPEAPTTTVHVNSPKILVAVFRPVETKRLPDEHGGAGGGGGFGPGAAIPSVMDLSTPGYTLSLGGAVRPDAEIRIVPVATPEPATFALLALGALALRRTNQTTRST